MKTNKKPRKIALIKPAKDPKRDVEIDTSNDQPTIIIFTNFTRFKLGAVAATKGALALLEKTGFSAAALIRRHAHGDWGNIGKEDRASNEYAVPNMQRIVSVYRLVDAGILAVVPESKRAELPTAWVITEGDRSSTVILLPSEY